MSPPSYLRNPSVITLPFYFRKRRVLYRLLFSLLPTYPYDSPTTYRITPLFFLSKSIWLLKLRILLITGVNINFFVAYEYYVLSIEWNIFCKICRFVMCPILTKAYTNNSTRNFNSNNIKIVHVFQFSSCVNVWS